MEELKLIPLKKLSDYPKDIHFSNYFCSKCNHFNEYRMIFPYAYDEENNDIIFAARCNGCSNINLFKE